MTSLRLRRWCENSIRKFRVGRTRSCPPQRAKSTGPTMGLHGKAHRGRVVPPPRAQSCVVRGHSRYEDEVLEEGGCALTVRDVSELLHAQYAIISGGKSREGCPIITFPDRGNFAQLGDEEYRKLIIYLTSVPSLQDADMGFVLIIDRRNDKWNSVKTVLLKISGFFPGLIAVAYVLRPAGFLQKAISEVSNKIFRDEFKFKVVVCNCVGDLHDYIDRNQLTEDLSGCIPYNHDEWIEQRVHNLFSDDE